MGIPEGGIAFFDSGIGGLTVLAECMGRLPDEFFYYYGDNKHAPYGNLPPEQIRRYVFKAFEKFRRLRVKAAVVACNTVTALCVEELRRCYDFPIVGAEPAVFPAAKKGGEIFVLTTRATYNSERFHSLCRLAEKHYPSARLWPLPCDALAGAIEANLQEKDVDFVSMLPKGKPDAVVLGCTHYIYIKKEIRNFYGCEVFDGNEGIAERLCSFFRNEKEKNLFQSEEKKQFSRSFFRDTQPLLTTTEKEGGKMNKSSLKMSQKMEKNGKKAEKKNLFFLGNQKGFNKNILKQMFVFNQNGVEIVKSGSLVVKKSKKI